MQNSYSSDNKNYQYAGFWVRFSAYVIDSALIFLALLIVRLILFIVSLFVNDQILNGNLLFNYSLKDIVVYGCSVCYFVCSTYYTGTTIGKRLMRLKVISKKQNNKLTFLDVLYRETVGRFLSSIFINVGYMMIGIDQEKCALHDILCDTRVIYDIKKNEELQNTSVEINPEIKMEISTQRQVETEDEKNCDDGTS